LWYAILHNLGGCLALAKVTLLPICLKSHAPMINYAMRNASKH
jgi:hypothetical protein